MGGFVSLELAGFTPQLHGRRYPGSIGIQSFLFRIPWIFPSIAQATLLLRREDSSRGSPAARFARYARLASGRITAVPGAAMYLL